MPVTIQDDMVRIADRMPPEERSRFLCALLDFGIKDKEPDENEPWYSIFEMAKPRLAMSAQHFRDGAKGGRPKKRS